MANKNLSLKEIETTKTFVIQINKQFQKLQECKDYSSIKKTLEDLGNKMDNSKWANAFTKLTNDINNKL